MVDSNISTKPSAQNVKESLFQDLPYALEREQLALYYQSKHCLKTEKIIGMEALLRWNHPTHGLLLPAEFSEQAEETGLILTLSHWLFSTVSEFLRSLKNTGIDGLNIAVNISADQITQIEFESVIHDLLNICQETGNTLELELTESVVVKSIDVAVRKLESLRQKGAQIVLDDFGTGFSSLSYLQQLPVDKLKIDKLFTQHINEHKNPIIDAIINLAHDLNIKVIAEGVENEFQLTYFKNNNCHEAQGYLFSKPLSAEEFIKLIKRN